MEKKLYPLLIIIMVVTVCGGLPGAPLTKQVVFLDDFNAYDIEDNTDFSIDGVPTGNWSADQSSTNASRIFQPTTTYDRSKLWISIVDGTTLTSAGIELESDTNYSFSVFLGAETFDPARQLDVSYDLLIGQDAATASSILGGSAEVIAVGDDGAIPDSKEDQIFTHDFTTGSLGVDDKLFIKIRRIGVHAGSNPFFAVDDVSIEKYLRFGIDETEDLTAVVENTGSDRYHLLLLPDPNTAQPASARWPSSPVTVTITPDTQVNVLPSSVVFPAWTGDPNDYAVPITVTAVDDTDIEGAHSGVIVHTAASADEQWDQQFIPEVVVSIEDDDGEAGIIIDQAALWVGEGLDPNASYTLSLGKPPAAGETVTVNVNSGTQLIAAPSSVVFTENDWNVLQSVTISAQDDGLVEGAHFAVVSHTVSSGDPEYSGLTVADIPVAIGDNEAQGPAGIAAQPAVWFNENSAINRAGAALAVDGEFVNLWEDQSGNRRYAQNTWAGATFPTFDAATNSAVFDGDQAILASDNWDETGLTQPTTIFCVGTVDDPTNTVYFYDSLSGSNRQILTAHSGGQWEIGAGVWQRTAQWYLNAPVLNTITFNGSGSLHRVNGLEVFTGDLGTQNLDGLSLGSRHSASNLLVGQISELIVYNQALSEADILAVENYLIDKWTGRIGIIESGGSTEINETGAPTSDSYDVQIIGAPDQPVEVTVTPVGEYAGDVNLGNGPGAAITLNFPAAAGGTQTVTVDVVDNVTSEGPRQVTLSHTSSSADSQYHDQAVDVQVTVNDDEAWCGQEGTVYYDADLDRDCYVTLKDFAILAGNWMDCTNPGDPACD